MKRLRDYEKEMFDQLHGVTEQVVLGFSDTPEYQSAYMGNELRRVTDERQQVYTLQIAKELTCLQDFLADIIAKDDQELLRNRQNQDFVQSCPEP